MKNLILESGDKVLYKEQLHKVRTFTMFTNPVKIIVESPTGELIPILFNEIKKIFISNENRYSYGS